MKLTPIARTRQLNRIAASECDASWMIFITTMAAKYFASPAHEIESRNVLRTVEKSRRSSRYPITAGIIAIRIRRRSARNRT